MIERSNLVNISKLIVKELIEQSLRYGRMLDSDHLPLHHFFIVLEHVMRHGLKPKKVCPILIDYFNHKYTHLNLVKLIVPSRQQRNNCHPKIKLASLLCPDESYNSSYFSGLTWTQKRTLGYPSNG